MIRRCTFWGLLGLTLLMYLPALRNFPVADSWVFLEPKSLTDTAGYFVRSVIPAEWNALWFRPLPMFTFWIDTILWPDSYWGPHLFNIILHLINTALIWRLVSKFTKSGNGAPPLLPPFIAGLFYAIHPLTVGSVAWIAARFDVMSVTFGLGALNLWYSWIGRPQHIRHMAVCLLLLCGALLSKEQGIVFSGAVFLSALYGAYSMPAQRRVLLRAAALVTGFIVIYFAYRITLFHGLGGYLESKQILSLKTPLGFFTALLFPYPNLAPQWNYSLLPVLTSVVAFILILVVSKSSNKPSPRPDMSALVLSGGPLAIGLASTGPHAGLGFMSILGHIESRFALIALSGMALVIGWLWATFVRTDKIRQLSILIAILWAISALWRSDIQLAAWRSASETARNIITTTTSEVPDPNPGTNLYYLFIPSYSEQNAYIFGIGLKEAVRHAYRGHNNLMIHPHATREDVQKAVPFRDEVFVFNREIWMLEHLHPQQR